MNINRVYTRYMLRKHKGSASQPGDKNFLLKGDQSIIAFTEEISTDSKQHDLSTQLNAHELFGIFTADIIKTNVLFIR